MKKVYRILGHTLRSPVTVLLLLVVMGITFPVSLQASNKSSKNAAKQADTSKQIAQFAVNNAKTLQLAFCGLVEPLIVVYNQTPPDQLPHTPTSDAFRKWAFDTQKLVHCTKNLTDGK